MNSCLAILSNSTEMSATETVILIKNAYMEYLEKEIKNIIFTSLAKKLDITPPQEVTPAFKLIFAALHTIETFEKFGRNVMVPLSSFLASYEKSEILIGTQIYSNNKPPLYSENIRRENVVYDRLAWLIYNDIKLSQKILGTNHVLNVEDFIDTGNFIDILNEIYVRVTRKEPINFFPNSDFITVSGLTTYNKNIKVKDAIVVLHEFFSKTYNDDFVNIYPVGNSKQLKTIKALKFIRSGYRQKIETRYGSYGPVLASKIYDMYSILFTIPFKQIDEMELYLTNRQAVSLIYDYAKYHHLRK